VRGAGGRVLELEERLGKPKKSWMVRGRAMAVTAVAAMYQWAEMASTARGVPTARPRAAQASVKRFVSRAFMDCRVR